MARYNFQVLKVSKISKLMPYNCRYRLQDDALKASVKRSGILMPVIVTDAARSVVIAGHRRFEVVRDLKIKELPVLVARKMKPQEAFLLNLVSNWRESYSDADRAMALGKTAREFHFKESDILSIVMPLLGLPEDKTLLEFYRKVDLFPPSLKDLMENGQLPLRGAAFLLKFEKNDQDYFAKNIGAKHRLTTSQILQTGEWLADILKGTGKTLEAICEKNKILEKLNVFGMDPRTKADRFFARVKRLRFPGYSRYLEKFEERRTDILHDSKELRLEPIQGFEEPGFELHARVKTRGELESLLQKLSQKRSTLNSLFEIVL